MNMPTVSATDAQEFRPSVIDSLAGETRPNGVSGRSWVFRWFDHARSLFDYGVGLVSLIFCIAVVANIPVLQFLSFGYLLEVSGRLARGGKFRDSFVGLSKATKIGGLLLGTWLLLLPARFFAEYFLQEAYLIDPASIQTRNVRWAQIVIVALTLIQVISAWLCGGKLRYFFWQLFAPLSLAIWLLRRSMGSRIFRPVLNFCVGWISPNLVNDLCSVKSPKDWFVPAILWEQLKSGSIYATTRDRLWDFVVELKLWYYFKLGFVGLMGSIIWLAVPTMLLIAATRLDGSVSVLCGIAGAAAAIPVFSMLFLVQTRFAETRRFASFFEIMRAYEIFSHVPVSYVLAFFLSLVMSLPLFLLKIEEIPGELLWLLSLVFVAFSLPSRLFMGLAYRRRLKQVRPASRWLRWPVAFMVVLLAASYVAILSSTRYVSWNGALSLIENHVFLLPAPFWL